MIKFPATHVIEADRAEVVTIGKTPQISLYSGDADVHNVVMPPETFEKLGRDIAKALKAKS